MVNHLVAAFDGLGNVRNVALRDNAVESLRALSDKRVFQALHHYVTTELRLANISQGSLATRQIDTFAVNSGANTNIPVQLALPIQTPELNVTRVRTTVVAPAVSALRAVSGQDFGDDWERWGRWIEKQK